MLLFSEKINNMTIHGHLAALLVKLHIHTHAVVPMEHE